jgi:hypothetical protein
MVKGVQVKKTQGGRSFAQPSDANYKKMAIAKTVLAQHGFIMHHNFPEIYQKTGIPDKFPYKTHMSTYDL